MRDILTAYEGYYGTKGKDNSELERYREYIFETLAKSPLVYVKLSQIPQTSLVHHPFEDLQNVLASVLGSDNDIFNTPLEELNYGR